jgi:hypothetical protein
MLKVPGFIFIRKSSSFQNATKMTKKSDLVEKQFSMFNCAQTVFSLFAEDCGAG